MRQVLRRWDTTEQSCPELKKAWLKDPNSYDGREYARHEARKKAPKTCSYCKETGHTRAGCADIKRHKEQFRSDAMLFRRVIVKWMKEMGIGVGALVRSKDAQWHDATRTTTTIPVMTIMLVRWDS